MKKLLTAAALLLSLGSARAQAVTKLPGEETLSLRERAERDFLMPVRRKKVAAEAPAKEARTIGEETSAAPETDGSGTTANFAEATDETARPAARPDEAAAPARAARSYAARRTAWLARRRAEARAAERAAERRAAARKGSKAKAGVRAKARTKVKTKTKASGKAVKGKAAGAQKAAVKTKARKAPAKVPKKKAAVGKRQR